MSIKIEPLAHIADIRSGYFIKTGIAYLEPGDIRIIQMKDLTNNDLINADALSTWAGPEEKSITGHYLRSKDIVFVSRGIIKRAVLCEPEYFTAKEVPAKMIAAKPLMVIQVDRTHQKIMPEFLTWYLNQPIAQDFFLKKSTGVNQQTITLRVLASLEVPIPPLEVQDGIVKTDRTMARAQRLHRHVALEQNNFFMRYIWNQNVD